MKPETIARIRRFSTEQDWERFQTRLTYTGFTAQIIQHEIDHLGGILNGENRGGVNAMTIRESIDSQAESIRPRLDVVYDTIRAAIPVVEERLSWGMPTF